MKAFNVHAKAMMTHMLSNYTNTHIHKLSSGGGVQYLGEACGIFQDLHKTKKRCRSEAVLQSTDEDEKHFLRGYVDELV